MKFYFLYYILYIIFCDPVIIHHFEKINICIIFQAIWTNQIIKLEHVVLKYVCFIIIQLVHKSIHYCSYVSFK